MRWQRRGATLAELMMASFLLAIVLTVSGRLAWLASRSKSSSEAQNLTFRHASIAFERMQRELIHCREIYAPQDPLLPFDPANNRPMVMRSRSSTSATGDAVIAYYRDNTTEELMRFTYLPHFDPDVAALQVIDEEPKAVASGLLSFHVYQVDPTLRFNQPTLRLNLVVSNKEAKRALRLPMSTEVRMVQ